MCVWLHKYVVEGTFSGQNRPAVVVLELSVEL